MEICKLLLERMKKIISEIEFQLSQEQPRCHDKFSELKRLGDIIVHNLDVWWNPED